MVGSGEADLTTPIPPQGHIKHWDLFQATWKRGQAELVYLDTYPSIVWMQSNLQDGIFSDFSASTLLPSCPLICPSAGWVFLPPAS